MYNCKIKPPFPTVGGAGWGKYGPPYSKGLSRDPTRLCFFSLTPSFFSRGLSRGIVRDAQSSLVEPGHPSCLTHGTPPGTPAAGHASYAYCSRRHGPRRAIPKRLGSSGLSGHVLPFLSNLTSSTSATTNSLAGFL